MQGGITDFPKVLDFGLAKVTERQMRPGSMILTQEGMVFGTPEFMSPEQARGEPLDARSDIYSLGTILYELITGKLPFDAKQPMDYINKHINEPPIPLAERAPGKTFPPGLQQVIDRALEKDRNTRHASAAEFGQALRDVVRGKLITGVMRSLPTSSSQPPPTAPNTPSFGPGTVSGPGLPPASVNTSDPSAQTEVPAPPAAGSSVGKLTWVVFGAGLLLAISGGIALAVALLRG
jgi:serine/threonine-protein kinase